MTKLRLEAITSINIHIPGKEITDIKGIRNLVYLDELHLYQYNLKTLNLSGMKHLREISCSSHALTSLNIQDTPALEILISRDSQLTSLDLSGHPNLFYIDCSYNKLSTLNLNNLPKLEYLNCNNNQISTLNATGMKLNEQQSLLYCGNQKDAKDNDLTLQLTLSEPQKEAWEEWDDTSFNANVQVKYIP